VKSLVFVSSVRQNRKRVQNARFEERSSLPASAACVVASGVRETLSALLRTSVALSLFEPTIPTAPAWSAIVQGAQIYRLRARKSDAAIVLRPPDAAALAAAVFGEPQPAGRASHALSPIEREVVDRVVRAIARSLAAVCGTRDGDELESVREIEGFVTYFELQLEAPVAARIGIALSSDPPPEPRDRLTLADLSQVELAPTASLDLGSIETGAIPRLSLGVLFPLVTLNLHRVTLQLYGHTLARGICGVRNGRYALTVQGDV
jgi:flagellar motor switch protein FliM